MTCIVAVVHDGIVYMGGDSAAAAWGNSFVHTRSDAKVFKLGEAVVGFTSSWRMGQVLRYELKLPEIPEGCELHEYMVRCFVPKLREAAKLAGILTTKEGAESLGQFLVGLRGRLFCVDNDFGIAEHTTGYMSVGCGMLTAEGALFATAGRSPQERVRIALEAAAFHMDSVRAPFVYCQTSVSEHEHA